MEIILIMGILLFLTTVFVIYCFVKAYNPNLHIINFEEKNNMEMFKIDQEVKIHEDGVYPNYSQMFTEKWRMKNLLTGKYENIKKKYGLRWCYRHFPTDNTLVKYYVRGKFNHVMENTYDDDKYVYLIEASNKEVYLVGESGLISI